MTTKSYINHICYRIIGCSIEVHKHLGPGLLESVYKECLIEELERYSLNVKSEMWLPVIYKERILKSSLRLDLLVNDLIVVELKACEVIIPLHKAQLLSYLKLTSMPKGLLINFHCDNIVKGMVPMVTGAFSRLPD